MYEPSDPDKYKEKALETLNVFKQSKGDVEKTAIKLNRGTRTVYRHLRFLGYEFPEMQRDEKSGRLKSPAKSAYLKNLEKVKVNGKQK